MSQIYDEKWNWDFKTQARVKWTKMIIKNQNKVI